MKFKELKCIRGIDIVGASTKFKWNEEISCQFDRKESPKLLDAIDASSYKAKMGLGALVTEMIAWRFFGLTDTADAFQRIDAAWCCAIDPLYGKENIFEFTKVPSGFLQDERPIQGALETCLFQLYAIQNRYLNKDIYLAENVATQILIAQHVIPHKKQFSSLISKILKDLSITYPMDMNEDDYYELDEYDCSHEKPVFRQFFDPEFDYTEESAQGAINEFLSSVDYKNNPYLLTPDEMIEAGFPGTPYSY